MPIRPKDGFGSNLPVAVHLCERPESALCSRWATTLGMGEDAPFQSLPRIALTAGLDKVPTFAPRAKWLFLDRRQRRDERLKFRKAPNLKLRPRRVAGVSVSIRCGDYFALRRLIKPTPARPTPINDSVAGSGTALTDGGSSGRVPVNPVTFTPSTA